MKIRHKTPGFVSMWMLDVFCCALGCVTLLWLLKTRDASTAWEQTQTVQAELLQTQLNLFDQNLEAVRLQGDIDEAQKNLILTQRESDQFARQLALVRREKDDAANQLAMVRGKLDSQAKQLALTREEADAKARELAAAEKVVAEAEQKFRNGERQTDELMKRVSSREADLAKQKADLANLSRSSADARSRIEELERLNAQLAADSKEQRMRSQANSASTDELQKKLDRAATQIIDLQGTKAKMADELAKVQADKESRFAGIALTGKRVVFLVDMSGSMDRTDENTLAPHKWPIVAETVGKVMRSLPQLEKYQIIMFSNRLIYPLGSAGSWIDYDSGPSEKRAEEVVKATRPSGDTNMYDPFEAAFRMREKGLDSIYLLSDGLPNAGPGLTPAQQRANLSETQLGEYLGKYIRQTMNQSWNRPDAAGKKVRINSIGFFYESPDVGAFLWALSRENDGSFVGMSKP